MSRIIEGKLKSNGIELHYVDMGPESGEPLLLVMGLACQLTVWPQILLDQLVDAGYRIIIFDNRDIGLSTEINARLEASPPVAFLRFKMGFRVAAPYSLLDMVNDAKGLLDGLGIESAHVVGVSMGGMITQLFCATYPEVVRSATIIMSSDNHPKNPAPDIRVLWKMNGGGVKGHHLEAAIARGMAFWQAVQSPGFPTDFDLVKTRLEDNYRRSYRPAGILRQMRAIMATGDIGRFHEKIKQPVQIIHGDADPLVKLQCGERLAKGIAHSHLEVIKGMGHDLPAQLMPDFAELIDKHASRA